MKVYVTKRALIEGIIVGEATLTSQRDMVRVIGPSGVTVESPWSFGPCYHGEGREWHLTLEGAIAKAEDMRDKKIDALQKQIEKLKSLRFDKVETFQQP